ncbi:LysM domain-containing protein [Alkalinema pantanalense CENA528]|uniref:LysM domain-containing protein n=1 Tax=Alkalinema pantanalense TaxID=1620705 RepID=UPI003D6E874C
MFEHTSRYYNLETVQYTPNTPTPTNADADRRTIAYKRRRFLPQGRDLPVLSEVILQEGDRLDLITHDALGDPEQFWQVCDANNAMNPEDLLADPNRRLRIPIPQA